jgi:hypothetical protein
MFLAQFTASSWVTSLWTAHSLHFQRTLLFRSWCARSFVYTSMCLWDGQNAFSAQFSVIVWLCLTPCSIMYHPLSRVRRSLIMAGIHSVLLPLPRKLI